MPTEELFGAYHFLLEVAGVTAGAFNSIEGVDTNKSVAGVTATGSNKQEIRLRAGTANTEALWTWRQAMASRGVVSRDVVIKKVAPGGRIEMEWRLVGATLEKFQAPAFSRKGTVTPISDLVLKAKPPVTLGNVGQRFGGSYYVRPTTHNI